MNKTSDHHNKTISYAQALWTNVTIGSDGNVECCMYESERYWVFFLYVIFVFYFDPISGPSTSGHVWPSGLYIVNLYCLHESHLK